MSLLQDKCGKTSAMRVGLMSSLAVGAILCIGGLVGIFTGAANAIGAINAGAMLMGSSGFAKAVQSKYEAKHVD